jgi:hypothetical protein
LIVITTIREYGAGPRTMAALSELISCSNASLTEEQIKVNLYNAMNAER